MDVNVGAPNESAAAVNAKAISFSNFNMELAPLVLFFCRIVARPERVPSGKANPLVKGLVEDIRPGSKSSMNKSGLSDFVSIVYTYKCKRIVGPGANLPGSVR